MNKPSLVSQLKKARARGVPLLAIATQDPIATTKTILSSLPSDLPLLSWDIVDGLSGIGASGIACQEQIAESTNLEALKGDGGLVNSLVFLRSNFSESGTPIFLTLHNAHRALDDLAIIQALSLSRDWAKKGGYLSTGSRSSHCVILLGTSFSLPPELSQDILSLEDAPPSEEEIKSLLVQVTSAAGLPEPQPETLAKSAEALLSLSHFAVEQEAAMSLTKEGLNIADLGERRRVRVQSSPGLYMPSDKPDFSSTGGYTEAKSFLTQLFAGPLGIRSIFFFDEIEKALGSSNDSSGVGLRMLGQLLTHMSLSKTSGILFHGVPGSGKTALAQACSGEFGVPFINCSLSEMQNSLVGQSEANLKRALEIDKSIGQGKSLWIATCNEVERIPAPLFRRFDLATFTFDLPTQEERASIWPIQLANYGLDQAQELPLDDGWTGSDIASCCKKAFALGVTVVEASKRVIPLSLSARKTIEKCHKEAEGCFLSSSYPGPFKTPVRKAGDRAITLEESQQAEQQPQLVVINAAPSPFQFSPNESQEPLPKKDKIGF